MLNGLAVEPPKFSASRHQSRPSHMGPRTKSSCVAGTTHFPKMPARAAWLLRDRPRLFLCEPSCWLCWLSYDCTSSSATGFCHPNHVHHCRPHHHLTSHRGWSSCGPRAGDPRRWCWVLGRASAPGLLLGGARSRRPCWRAPGRLRELHGSATLCMKMPCGRFLYNTSHTLTVCLLVVLLIGKGKGKEEENAWQLAKVVVSWTAVGRPETESRCHRPPGCDVARCMQVYTQSGRVDYPDAFHRAIRTGPSSGLSSSCCWSSGRGSSSTKGCNRMVGTIFVWALPVIFQQPVPDILP